MANEFVARNGLIAQNNSTITGSLTVGGSIQVTGSLGVTGSARITGSLNIIGAGNLSAPISITTFFQTSSQVNTFNIPHDGAASRVYTGLTTTPILNYTGAGAGTGTMYGLYTFPTVVSSSLGTNSRITLGGLFVNASRVSAADLSSFSGNAVYGIFATAGHGGLASSGSVTGLSSAIRTQANNGKGTITTLRGVFNEVFVAANNTATTASTTDAQGIYNIMTVGAGVSTGHLSSVTNAYGVQNLLTVGGGSGGTSTLTNYYGFYQATPTVGTGGTLTNKYGLYFVDPNMPSYHAGNFGVGTTSPSAQLTIGRLDSSNEGGQIDLCRASDNASTFGIDVYGTGTTPSLRILDLVSAASRIEIDASGNVTISSLGTGTVYSNSGVLTNTDPSDSRLKNSINPLSHGLTEILKLEPKTFYYNSDDTKSSLKYGFIAQDVQLIMPDLVRAIGDGSDKLGLESNGIYVAMVNAIKEQQSQIQSLLTRIETLENK